MIIGTAGHIDHGKTALVKALTGVDTDRLQEEKARGITIDLGYAYAPLPGEDILGFVDVPGHERFVPNMLAGATGVDYVLLVVAADDGPMPQTIEHLQIIDLLGLCRGAVALTKIDRVAPERVAETGLAIEHLLSGTTLAGSPIFPVSAVSGEGVAALRNHLTQSAGSASNASVRGRFRLAVDRCFLLTGVGAVVTGSVFSGQTFVGDRLLLSPGGHGVRVRAIHAQNRSAETGVEGQRCALNLAGVDKQDVHRGDWIVDPMLHAPTTRLDVRVRVLHTETKPLRHWTEVQVHLGAGHVAGRIALLQDEPVEPGTEGLAQIVLVKPVCALHGDRVILRDVSARRTIGGGTVLDSHAPARGRRSAHRRAVLAAWSQPNAAAILEELLRVSANGVDLADFARKLNHTSAEMDELCRSISLRSADAAAPLAFAPEHWSSHGTAALSAVSQAHADAPDALGLNIEQLRLRAAPGIRRSVFSELVAELVANGMLARDGSWLHLPGHEITLSAPEEALWNAVAPLLEATPFQPPRVRDLARILALDEAVVRALMARVARVGRVYRVAHDHYFLRGAVADLAAILSESCGIDADGSVMAAAFRDRIGVGRKLAIQILEFFDRTGLTRRVRDAHRLRNSTLEF